MNFVMWMRFWKKRNLGRFFWWEYKLVQTLKKTIWVFLGKLKAELPYDLVIPYIQTVYIYM